MTHLPEENRYVCYYAEEGVFAVVLKLGAHASLLRYNVGGMQYEVYVNNEDFILRSEDDDE